MSTRCNPTTLARGGMVVATSIGPIQFGAVPETIKDTMPTAQGVPRFFLLGDRMFDTLRGVSLADLEFPIYFNYFALGATTHCICQPSQRRAIATVLREAIFGPNKVDVSSEVIRGPVPALAPEMSFFRKSPFTGARMELEDMVQFWVFDREGKVNIEGVEIRRRRDGKFAVKDQGRLIAEFSEVPPVPDPAEEPTLRLKPFGPPAFGITFIGTGHGFDPNTMTSGFIVWANHRGILVDPPVNTTEWLKRQEINPKLIDSIILTHCHADHDGGTLQKILSEGRVRVFATPTVIGSFVHKYRQLVNMDRRQFEALFDYVPVSIGEPIRINGAEFFFHYTLHSVPCVGFEVFYSGKSLVYTSDTLYEPDTFDLLHSSGVIREDRRDQLLNFPWHHDLVVHEAGIPPIHTKVETLAQLPPDVKQRMLLIHISPKNLPVESGLGIAPAGLESTVVLAETVTPRTDSQEVLDVLGRVDLFKDFPLARAGEVFSMVKRRQFRAGERVIEKGTPGDCFYMIVSGKAVVKAEEADDQAVYGPYDYLGETALILDVPRTADVWAMTELDVLTMGRHDFLYCLRGTELPAALRRLAKVRKLDSWELLDRSDLFHPLTATQRTQLQSLMEVVQPAEGEVIAKVGERLKFCYLVAKGQIEVLSDDRRQRLLRKGDFVGQVLSLQNGSACPYTLRAVTNAVLYRIPRRQMAEFLKRNPGLYVRLAESGRKALV